MKIAETLSRSHISQAYISHSEEELRARTLLKANIERSTNGRSPRDLTRQILDSGRARKAIMKEFI